MRRAGKLIGFAVQFAGKVRQSGPSRARLRTNQGQSATAAIASLGWCLTDPAKLSYWTPRSLIRKSSWSFRQVPPRSAREIGG
jgi:hypothetical protein